MTLALALCLNLASCALVALPFKVAGKVVGGTAKLGKSAYDASVETFRGDEDEKPEKKPEKIKPAEKNRPPDSATSQPLPRPEPDSLPSSQEDSLPPLPPLETPSY